MSQAAPDPVEKWAPLFTKFFTDEQLLKPEYAVSTGGRDGAYCKLCDHRVHGTVDDHIAEHRRELGEWRGQRKVEQAEKARENLAALRQPKADAVIPSQEQEGTSAPAAAASAGGVSPERRLKNRISSLKFKLKNPGKAPWTDEQVAKIQEQMAEAAAELNALATKEAGL